MTESFENERKLQLLAAYSRNEFYAIGIQVVEQLPPIAIREIRGSKSPGR